MRFAGKERLRFFVLATIVGVLGLASLVYILLQQRFTNPLVDTYTVQAELIEADGVVAGLGQPVNVAGVKVGSITDTELSGDVAVVTMEIESDLLPSVSEDATVTLEPITPLEDMQIDLDPGDPDAEPLAADVVIPAAGNSSPVPLSNLLAALDTDTRAYMRAMINSLGEGTEGAGADMRGMLRAMGPTTEQVGLITDALDARRRQIKRLVTNLAAVADAASRDEQLATLVAAGNQTLAAVASEEPALGQALDKLPSTLATTRSTLEAAGDFSDRLGPALSAIRPGVQALPGALDALEPFARAGITGLRTELRPLVREAQPLVSDLGPPLRKIKGASPDLWDSLQATRFLLNSLAYNPPGDDEGGLFWTDWWAHNANSAFGAVGDAHGRSARSIILANCSQWAGFVGDLGKLFKLASGVATICPETKAP